jgi:hypothetical protein
MYKYPYSNMKPNLEVYFVAEIPIE